MDPKEYLKQYQLYKAIAAAYKKTELEAAADLEAVKLNVKYYQLREKTRQYAAQLRRTIKECGLRYDQAVSVCAEIKATIESVPDPTERRLLWFRYIDGLTWAEIEEQLHYSMQHVHNIHNRTLEKNAEIWYINSVS